MDKKAISYCLITISYLSLYIKMKVKEIQLNSSKHSMKTWPMQVMLQRRLLPQQWQQRSKRLMKRQTKKWTVKYKMRTGFINTIKIKHLILNYNRCSSYKRLSIFYFRWRRLFNSKRRIIDVQNEFATSITFHRQ